MAPLLACLRVPQKDGGGAKAPDLHALMDPLFPGQSSGDPPTRHPDPSLKPDPSLVTTLTGRIVGPYQVEERLGGGAMASVYRAREISTGRILALKVLLPDADETVRERFRQEARTVRVLNHPNIVPTLGISDEESGAAGATYIAMELVEGESLGSLLDRTRTLTPRETCALAEPIARALALAHANGIVHRDVKPGNILLRRVRPGNPLGVTLSEDGTTVAPLLSDFGIARALDAPDLTSVGRTIGTPAFMAPEQCAGHREIDGRADLYSLGAVIYRCVTGRPPFTGTTTQILYAHVYDPVMLSDEQLASLPECLVAVLRRTLAKEPEERYSTANELAAHLRDCIAVIDAATFSAAVTQDEPAPMHTITMPGLAAVPLPVAPSPAGEGRNRVLVPGRAVTTETSEVSVRTPSSLPAAVGPGQASAPAVTYIPYIPPAAPPGRQASAPRTSRTSPASRGLLAATLVTVPLFLVIGLALGALLDVGPFRNRAVGTPQAAAIAAASPSAPATQPVGSAGQLSNGPVLAGVPSTTTVAATAMAQVSQPATPGSGAGQETADPMGVAQAVANPAANTPASVPVTAPPTTVVPATPAPAETVPAETAPAETAPAEIATSVFFPVTQPVTDTNAVEGEAGGSVMTDPGLIGVVLPGGALTATTSLTMTLAEISGTAPIPEGDIENFWKEAQDVYAVRDWESTLSWLTLVKRKDPNYARGQVQNMFFDTYVGLAAEATQHGDLAGAAMALGRANAEVPDRAPIPSLLELTKKVVEADSGQRVDALRNLQIAHAYYAATLIRQNRVCDAADQYDAATAVHTDAQSSALSAELHSRCDALIKAQEDQRSLQALQGRLIYSSQMADGDYRIYLVAAQPGAQSQMVIDNGRAPALAPDGSHVAFYSTRSDAQGLAGFNLNAGLEPGARSILYSGNVADAKESPPSWNPQGDQLVFASVNPEDMRSSVFTLRIDGENQPKRLSYGLSPNWSWALNRIVWNGVDETGQQPGLWIMAPDGSDAVRFTDNGTDIRPVWSPAGDQIAFMSRNRSNSWDVWIESTLGGAPLQLTPEESQDGLPTFSPDGKYVAFVSDRGGRWNIWVAPVEGGEALLLTPVEGTLTNWLEHSLQWTR